jgi:2-C-methyl-D-erythritol 4-phosphate cytidylyltransferase
MHRSLVAQSHSSLPRAWAFAWEGPSANSFVRWEGCPLLVHSLRVFQSSPVIDAVISRFPKRICTIVEWKSSNHTALPRSHRWSAGGKERQDSFRQALAVVGEGVHLVVIMMPYGPL